LCFRFVMHICLGQIRFRYERPRGRWGPVAGPSKKVGWGPPKRKKGAKGGMLK
jgi:hypothetical protein